MARLQVHSIDQPESDITAFILSCNRLHLLKKTVESFLKTRDLPTKVVIVDDSGEPEVFEYLVKNYGKFADIVCFPENRGLWWAKDFMVSFCSTPYIFYVEEDWAFLNTGYLQKSKKILEDHRHIGTVDLSWRTFEEEGFDSYHPALIENEYFLKKPWQISPDHLPWFCWHGSPNLKRREDLLLLGRVEGFYTEWNIDRKFYALGFRGVFLKDRYVYHLGDHQSLMAHKRPTEWATPELLYPKELIPYRTYPAMDYYKMSELAFEARGEEPPTRNPDICLVTCVLDINRESYDQRNFEAHYLNGLKKIIELGLPLVIFTDSRYYEAVLAITGGKPVYVIPICAQDIINGEQLAKLQTICESADWLGQSEWMKTSVIRSPHYIGLTWKKLELLSSCAERKIFLAKKYYWIDAGICNSFSIETLTPFNFAQLPEGEALFMTKFPYYVSQEMHGYSREGFLALCGQVPDFVCRATLFGGTKTAIKTVEPFYKNLLQKSLAAGYAGTEEALFSGLVVTNPELFNLFEMPNGGITNYLETLRK
jgi:glycosyltransferase involved in cell wall biosynthesis